MASVAVTGGSGKLGRAVVADLVDVARGRAGPAFGVPADALAAPVRADAGGRLGRAYLRFTVADRVGVLAEIAAVFRPAARASRM